MKRIVCMALTCLIFFGNICVNARAAEGSSTPMDNSNSVPEVMATGAFNLSVSPYGRSQADKTFPLEAGETVRIYATYSPDNASVDFGLVDPEGVFHYFNATNGSIDRTIEIKERGNYRLAVQNNSGHKVQISRFVKY